MTDVLDEKPAASFPKVSFILGLIFFMGLCFYTYSAMHKVEESHEYWSQSLVEMDQKAHVLKDMLTDIGYGGMIHNFKNYILRADSTYYAAAQDDVQNFKAKVQAYQIFPLTDKEASAIATLKKTVVAYETKLGKAREVRETNFNIELKNLDRIVRIDDTPAMDAIEILRSENHGNRKGARAIFEADLEAAHEMLMICFFWIALLFVLFLWQLRPSKPG